MLKYHNFFFHYFCNRFSSQSHFPAATPVSPAVLLLLLLLLLCLPLLLLLLLLHLRAGSEKLSELSRGNIPFLPSGILAMFDSLEFKSLSSVKACFLAALSTLHYFTGSSPQCRAPLLFLYLFLSLSLSPTHRDSLPTLSESLLSVCAASLAALELRLAARGLLLLLFYQLRWLHAPRSCCLLLPS